MPKVQILPSDVIARIAAGEVVERPASVVKELLENSLDAGATRVEVNLMSGGKTLIQVRDNGTGVRREDMGNLFFRHATSKISSGEDLESILSLGFRGEALYSVGSVSELTLKSRAAGSADAWEINVRGGERQAPVPAAMPAEGTDIRVEEIFFNTPARKKFLKSDTTEVDQVVAVVLPYALLYPQKHFVLTHNTRVIYDLPPAVDGAARAGQALALEAKHIITLDRAGNGPLGISGLLGDINIQRPRRDLQFVFVNGRPVQSRGLLFHLNDVYRLILPDGVHPFFILAVDIPPQEVDVNIHPSKREVRIKDEGRIGSLIRRAVEQALMTKGGPKEVRAEIFEFGTGARPEPGLSSGAGSGSQGLPSERLVFGPGQRSALPSFASEVSGAGRPSAPAPMKVEADFFAYAGQIAARQDESLKARLLRVRFIGTFSRRYHLFEEGDGLFVVDQHAAQERILFELFAAQMAAGKPEGERLLTPALMKLSPRELLQWENQKSQLDALGFEAELAGEGVVALHAHPRLIKAPEAVFRSLLSEEAKGLSHRDVLARRACRASVMSGENMHMDEAREQLRRLLACADPFTCPHGRPVFIELKSSFLDRHFLRT